MEKRKFHISTLVAVAHNEIWLAEGGIYTFCDILIFISGKDDQDIWNSDKIRRACQEEILTRFPFLQDIKLCSNCPKELGKWRRSLEKKYGSHLEVKNKGNISIASQGFKRTEQVARRTG